jgi:hypothetical protein
MLLGHYSVLTGETQISFAEDGGICNALELPHEQVDNFGDIFCGFCQPIKSE